LYDMAVFVLGHYCCCQLYKCLNIKTIEAKKHFKLFFICEDSPGHCFARPPSLDLWRKEGKEICNLFKTSSLHSREGAKGELNSRPTTSVISKSLSFGLKLQTKFIPCLL
jgi:hypothetical protein